MIVIKLISQTNNERKPRDIALILFMHQRPCFHVICHAHILRELTALIEQGSVWASLFHAFLLDGYQKKIAKESIEVRFSEIMIQANREEPVFCKHPKARGRPKQTKG